MTSLNWARLFYKMCSFGHLMRELMTRGGIKTLLHTQMCKPLFAESFGQIVQK